MGLKKTDLQHDTQFVFKHSKGNIFTLKKFTSGSSITCDILMNLNKGKAVASNQYNLESITDKYLTMWDIQFGQKRNFRVRLEDLEISNEIYETY